MSLWIGNSVLSVTAWHQEALSSDAKQWPEGKICLSYPQMHVGFFFLHTLDASALINPVYTFKYPAFMSAILNKTDIILTFFVTSLNENKDKIL